MIVGSGAGGAVAADRSGRGGLDVLVLESGPTSTTRLPDRPPRGAAADVPGRRHHDRQRKPAMPIPVGRAVGGTTVINWGTCFRAPARSLRSGASARDRVGREMDHDYESPRRRWREGGGSRAMGRNGQLCMEGAQSSAQAADRSPQRGRLRAMQLVPARMPARRETGGSRLLPPSRRGRRRPRARGCGGAADLGRGRSGRGGQLPGRPTDQRRRGSFAQRCPRPSPVLGGEGQGRDQRRGAFGTLALTSRDRAWTGAPLREASSAALVGLPGS